MTMGQRLSNDQPQRPEEEDTNRRNRVLRPIRRIEVRRNDPLRRPTDNTNEQSSTTTANSRSREVRSSTTIPNMTFIPLNGNQRREERRLRREYIRENSRESQAADAVESSDNNNNSSDDTSQNGTTTTTATMTTTEGAQISPFSRMIAQVISQAVVTSFRNGQIPALNNTEENQQNVRQQLTMHLSSELFRQMEPESTEDMFIRFIRLPVLVTRIAGDAQEQEQEQQQSEQQQSEQDQSTTSSRPNTRSTTRANNTTATTSDETTDEESEITRIVMLPVFLYGLRSAPSPPASESTNVNNEQEQSENGNQLGETPSTINSQQEQASSGSTSEQGQENTTNEETRETTNRHWTIYVIGGNHVESLMSDSPSYEELLNLASLIGSVRQPTVSQEEIDSQLTIDKFTVDVKQTIVGNADKCQVCLNDYQLDEDIRILSCHHAFHKDCIDQWLTQGQNKCPLCRKEAVTSTNNDIPTTTTE